MKVSEYSILRYGPLQDTGRVMLSDFNLIFGDNEYGKTLTIDALVKLLLGKASRERDFNAIQRVDENPEGYIVIQNGDDQIYKLPEQGTLPALFDISPADCGNIFIIRNSNPVIGNEHEYYTGVTDRLTGLQSRYIDKVIESLRSLGKLTPTGMFVNTGNERLKSRMDEAISLAEEVEQFRDTCESEKADKLEQSIVDIKNRIKLLSTKIDLLNEARMREKYEKGVRSLEKIVQARTAIAEMNTISDEHLQTWHDHARDITRMETERKIAAKNLAESRNDLDGAKQVLREQETEWKRFDHRKRELDETIRPLIKQYEQRVTTVPSLETRKSFFGIAALIAVILSGISMIGIILASGTFFSITAPLLFVLLVLSGGMYYVSVRALSDISADFKKLLNAVSRYGWDAETLSGILKNTEVFEDEYRRSFDRLHESRHRLQNLRERTDNLSENSIPEIDRTIRTMQEEIDAIRSLSGTKTIDDYRLKCTEKSELNKVLQTQSVLLKRDFGYQEGGLDEKISFWQRQISEFERYKDKATGTGYDEKALTGFKDEHKILSAELDDLHTRWSAIAYRLSDIEKRTNQILQTDDDYIFCKTLPDLTVILQLLDEFITGHENTRDDVLIAIDIFTSLFNEEQEKVGALFGIDKPVSKYFSVFTDGRYNGVTYDQMNATIEVTQRNGNCLTADKLSGGAYDQLYFAIRLALGEELLGGGKGFFILDDPFIKSDIHRLKEQMQMLRYMAGQGWQIIFFSAKTEILDDLKNDINDKSVLLIDYRRIQ